MRIATDEDKLWEREDLIHVHVGVKTWAMFLLEETFSMIGVRNTSVGKPTYIDYCHDLSADLYFNKKEVPYFIRKLNRLEEMGLSLGMHSSINKIKNQLYSQSWAREVYSKPLIIPYMPKPRKIDWDKLEREGLLD
tara:strand:+ start:312 stop:719 length:408 start_codon:yes stop_codon:yes gene_type:complete